MSKWIQKAIKRPGQLHRDLGVPQGQPIPRERLNAAAQGGGKTAQRARLAQTLRGFAGGGRVHSCSINGHEMCNGGKVRR